MRSDGSMSSEYIDWILGTKLKLSRRYFDICEVLQSIPYDWTVPLDSNRAEDGLYLRREFLEGEMDPFGKVSVLEVLAEFAIRIDSEYTGDPRDPHPDVIFMDFLKNLGLNISQNGVGRVTDSYEFHIRKVIFDWMLHEPWKIFGFSSGDPESQLWNFMLEWVSEM